MIDTHRRNGTLTPSRFLTRCLPLAVWSQDETAMLTLQSILRTTRQRTSYGEQTTRGALDHLPAKVEGPKKRRRARRPGRKDEVESDEIREWDDTNKVFSHR